MSRFAKANSIILRAEHGHPGYADYQVIGTPNAMRTLVSDVLRKLDVAGETSGRVESVECTLAHERADHVYVSFHIASKEDVERYHMRLPAIRARKALRVVYRIAAFLLAVYGLFRLFGG
jgi:hypothetical protein